ncbi:MAG TPA: hypothetical protein VGP93_13220 [Polyangiaceae bacterium]|nr:hypothetical protein [Polyangiaceae bacterium]
MTIELKGFDVAPGGARTASGGIVTTSLGELTPLCAGGRGGATATELCVPGGNGSVTGGEETGGGADAPGAEGCMLARRALGGGGGWLRKGAGVGGSGAAGGTADALLAALASGAGMVAVAGAGGGGATLRRGGGGGPDDLTVGCSPTGGLAGRGGTDSEPLEVGRGGAATGRGAMAGPLSGPLPLDSLSAIRPWDGSGKVVERRLPLKGSCSAP